MVGFFALKRSMHRSVHICIDPDYPDGIQQPAAWLAETSHSEHHSARERTRCLAVQRFCCPPAALSRALGSRHPGVNLQLTPFALNLAIPRSELGRATDHKWH